jgi:hypothetical protein
MPALANRSLRHRSKKQLAAALLPVMEEVESRIFFTAVTAWNFDSLAIGTNLSPAPSTGTGTALTVGFQTSSTNTNSPGGVYANPNPNASGTGDDSDILNGTGNNPTGNQADHSSTGDTTGSNPTGTNPAWRIRGTSDGWSDNAAVASQGAQFMASTAGKSGISLTFDLDASSGSAASEVEVEYTTNGGSTWQDAPSYTSVGTDSSNGNSDGVTIANNSTNANIVNGSYFQIQNNADALFWQNGLTVDFSSISAANNNPNFGVRIVNAATGNAEFEVGGTAFPPAGAGNWRLDNVSINASGGTLTSPSVATNPTNQTVPAGQTATFTAAATGNPAPTVQWYEGTVGSGTALINGTTYSGVTSGTLTINTSSSATDNGTTYYAVFTNSQGNASTTAATLTDSLAAPVVTTQPTAVSTTAGSTANFTAAASGSPVPTVQWYEGSVGSGTALTNGTVYSGVTTTTLSVTTAGNLNNDTYYAVFTNSQGSTSTTAASLALGGTALAAWNFSSGGSGVTYTAGQTILNPLPSTGTGTASSLGMGSAGTYSVFPGTTGNYTLTVTDANGNFTTGMIPAAGNATVILNALQTALASDTTPPTVAVLNSPSSSLAAGITLSGDAGATLSGSGTGTFFAGLDNSILTTSQLTGNPDNSNIVAGADTGSPNSDPAVTNAWRIVGNNGWNSNAPIGSQGAQFLTSTANDSSIEASFDLYATAQGSAKIQVEYTTNGTNWTNVPAADLSIQAGDTNISVQNNNTSGNTTTGGYFDITGGGSTNLWYNGLTANLEGISAVNNDPNFGIRIVNASKVADDVNLAGTALNNTSGNDRLGNVQIIGDNPVAPVVTTNPTNQSVVVPNTAAFTAAGDGYPAVTVQWYEGTVGSGIALTNGATYSGATTPTLTVTPSLSLNNDTYYAVFTNSVGSTSTTAATLTTSALPTVTTNPTSQTVAAGTSVTLTSAATGTPTPTVQWEVATPNGSGGFNAFNPISSATSATYAFTPTEGSSGDEYEAVWTNSAGSTSSTAATAIITGQPIAEWDFTGVLGTPASGSTAAETGNSPTPTFQTSGSSDSASVVGMDNLYSGTQAVPESDVLSETSAVNPSFSEYDWRVRGGSGHGNGGAGSPDGWSQLAPEYSQGVQFNVDTAGYDDITLHFDWDEGGIGDMQAQYLNSSGVWTNVGPLIQSTSSDYAGITSTTSPAGITVNLQGITYANDNPNLEVRLAAAYDPSLPDVVDGNSFDDGVNGDPSAVHGLYSSAGPGGGQDAEQTLQIPDVATSGNLSFGGATTTSPISFDPSNPTTTAAAIQSALQGLSTIGSGNVSVAETLDDQTGTLYTVKFIGSMADTPEPNLVTTDDYTNLVALGVQPIPSAANSTPSFTLTLTDSTGSYTTSPIDVVYNYSNDTVNAGATAAAMQTALQALSVTGASGFLVNTSHAQSGWSAYAVNLASDPGATLATNNASNAANLMVPVNFAVQGPTQQWQPGAATTSTTNTKVFSDSGSWLLGNINFDGEPTNGAPGITLEPVTQTVTAGVPISLTASAYSEATVTGVQWEVSTNGGSSFGPVTGSGAAGSTTSGTNLTGSGPSYSSTYTFTPPSSQEGASPAYQYEAIFTNANGPGATVPATITVVAPVAPTVTVAPVSESVEAGNPAVFTAAATGAPTPTVQWEMATPNGSGGYNAFTPLTNSATVSGAQSDTLIYTTNANGSENGDEFEAVFTNEAAPSGVASTPAILTVLRPETDFTDWNFADDPSTGNSAYTDDPAPVIGTGTASIVGMNLPYNSSDGGTGEASQYGAFADGDVTNSPGLLDPNFTENTWRVRSGVTQTVTPTNIAMSNGVATLTIGATAAASVTPGSPIVVYGISNQAFDSPQDNNGNPIPTTITSINTTAGTISYNTGTSTNVNSTPLSVGQVVTAVEGTGGQPGNGWSLLAASGTQGAQFSSSTQGYNHIYVTMDWYSTTSGILDAQPQYTLNGTTWINLGSTIQAVSDDFYGATAGDTSGTITSESLTSNVATITAPNNFTVGAPVSMANSGAPFNGTFTITAANSSSFSFVVPGANANVSPQAPPVVSGVTDTATENGLPIPLTFDVSNITGASNDPNFGVRLTSAVNPTLGTYAEAESSDASPIGWGGSKGNWRFDNIEFHGVPDWLDPSSDAQWIPADTSIASPISASSTSLTVQPGTGANFPTAPFQAVLGLGSSTETVNVTAVNGDTLTVTRAGGSVAWPAGTQISVAGAGTLTVTGAGTIVSDPESTGSPSGANTNIPVDPQIVASGSAAQLLIQPVTSNVDVHIAGVDLTNGAGIDMASVLGVDQGGVNGDERAYGANNVLVVGQVDQPTPPTFIIDPTSSLNLEDNDMIIHGDTPNADGSNPLFSYVQAEVQDGRNGGNWAALDSNGNPILGQAIPGLGSTAAGYQDYNDGVESVQLAPVFNGDLGTPDTAWTVGNAVEPLSATGNDIIIKYTYTGDFNLEGEVTRADYSILAGNFDDGADAGWEWADGDTNGDGLLTHADISNFDTAYLNGTGSAAANDPNRL